MSCGDAARWRSGLILVLVLVLLPLQALAAMKAEPLEWSLGSEVFSGVLVYDDASKEPRPGLVMVPNWRGVNASAVEKAKALAGDDYVVLVADVYGKGRRATNNQQAAALSGALKRDPLTLRARALKSIDVLKAQAGKVPLDASRIGAVGFCFGGTTVLEAVRSGAKLAGAVTLHGGLSTLMPATPGSATTPVLVLNGADDSSVPQTDIVALQKELDMAGADWQFVSFSGTAHCFAEADANSPPNCVYNPRSARRALRMLHDFFDERFAE